jgi:hypothetical protein
MPIDLVIAVQTSSNSGAVIDKLGGSGTIFTQFLAADGGQTAVISFSDTVQVHQDFTGNPDAGIHALRMLRKEGSNAHMLNALRQALLTLEQRPSGHRRIIFVIAEKRNRSSKVKLPEVMELVQRLNVTVYWLMYSPFLEPFTVRPQTTGGRTLSLLKKDALEHAIQLVSEEVHRQYILTFQPKGGAWQLHTIRDAGKQRADLRVKTREGYWTLP